MSAIKAFREDYVVSPLQDPDDFEGFDGRRVRYDIYWALYEQTMYRDIHKWAQTVRNKYGLYKYIRAIYNPSYRIGEFYKAHLWGGPLADAIPINTDNDNILPALTQLWQWSNWAVNKDILTLWGTVLGDVGLRVVDDVTGEKVYLEILDPSVIKDVTLDARGNVKAYLIEESRPDPESKYKREVTYSEDVTREGDMVVYQTYRNGSLYAWPDNTDVTGSPVAQWAEPYGFIPLVMIKHNDVGLDWGWSELHPVRSKVFEIDDVASMLGDQIRKAVNAKWFAKGMKQTDLEMSTSATSTSRPFPGREQLNAIWVSEKDATIDPLIVPIDIAGVISHIDAMMKELERDYPELRMDIWTVTGNVSGRALRLAREPVETKVQQRRANYDDALVRAQQMALAIGGMRGYFQDFGLDSYTKGNLQHQIASRPVFAKDPMDEYEISTAFWNMVSAAMSAGGSLVGILKENGWDDERISRFIGDNGEEVSVNG